MARFIWVVAGILGVCANTSGEPITPTASFDNGDCFLCHDDSTLTFEGGARTGESIYVNPDTYSLSVHKGMSCIDCHNQLDVDLHPENQALPPVDCAECHTEESATYGRSVHHSNGTPRVLPEGQPLPSCAGCHGTHDILSTSNVNSSLHFLNLTQTCGSCHESVARDIRESVHGTEEARGRRESPVCTDCHAEHAIQPRQAADAIRSSGEVCARCHQDERLSSKYGFAGGQVESYNASYHGLANRLGDAAVANCASCHGYHRILNSTDPRSTIYPANLQATCGSCHPGATANFASGGIHKSSPSNEDTGAKVNRIVKTLYLYLIFLVIGFMLFHNGLAWRRRVSQHLKNPHRTVERMSRALRIQHALLAASFTYLAISGFALAYPDSLFAWILGSDEGFRRWSHRFAGIFMLVLGAIHIIYLLGTKKGRALLKDFEPRWQDIKDLWQNLRYYLGKSPNKAKFHRFGYPEKLEYWAVLWGSIIMGITGLAIWFKLPVTEYFPRWVIDVATTIHFYEAILAVLAIIVWHLYHVIFDPGAYPMNGAWLDGKVTPEWMEEEHPLAEQAPKTEEDTEKD